jgi:hypothetical protein
MSSAVKVKWAGPYPKYTVLEFMMANGVDFNDGDTRAIRYAGDDFVIRQTFMGDSATGGWYDDD